MTHEEIDRKFGPDGADLDKDILLFMHRNQQQQFHEGNIVHVVGFTSSTSTGEVVDYLPHSNGYAVHFEDGETTEFSEDELRLATPDELYCYLHGRDKEQVRAILSGQPPQPFSTVRDDFLVGQAIQTEDGFGRVLLFDGDDAYYVAINEEWLLYHVTEMQLCNKGEIKTNGKANGWRAKEINAAIHLIMQ